MRETGERGLRMGEGPAEGMFTTDESRGSGSARKDPPRRATGDEPSDDDAVPCPWGTGGERRGVNGENAGSSHCGCGCSVNGGGMLSTGRAREKSTLGGGSVGRRMASKLRGRGCARAAALASSELSDASSG